MVMTLSGYLVIQDGQATTRPAAQGNPQAPATTGRDAQRIDTREFRDQIREQVRTSIEAAAQAEAQAAAQMHAPPVPAPSERVFTIRQGNGELTTMTMPPASEIIPPQVVDSSIAFFLMVAAIIIGLPLARAFARRMDRKGGGPAQIPREVSDQLVQINQAVDAIALEVERISEGQRYTTRLLSEQRDPARQTLPSGAQR
jgi:hypothetical protein